MRLLLAILLPLSSCIIWNDGYDQRYVDYSNGRDIAGAFDLGTGEVPDGWTRTDAGRVCIPMRSWGCRSNDDCCPGALGSKAVCSFYSVEDLGALGHCDLPFGALCIVRPGDYCTDAIPGISSPGGEGECGCSVDGGGAPDDCLYHPCRCGYFPPRGGVIICR